MKRHYLVLGVFALTTLAIGLAAGHAGLTAVPGVVINEIMYNPPWNATVQMDDRYCEWIELYNPTATPFDLGGYTVTTANDYHYVIPTGTKIEPGGYLIVASDVRAFQGKLPFGWQVSCPVVGKSGSDTPILGNMGSTIRIYNKAGDLIDEVTYSDRGEWPTAAAGGGSTLELRDPGRDNDDASNWGASAEATLPGTPGRANSVLAGSARWPGTVTVSPESVRSLQRLESVRLTVTNGSTDAIKALKIVIPNSWTWSGKKENVQTDAPGAEVEVSGRGGWGSPYTVIVTNLDIAANAAVTITLTRLVPNPLAGSENDFEFTIGNGEEWKPLTGNAKVIVTETMTRADHLVINEINCNTGETVTANYNDWVELYNPTSSPICIDGWFLLDALPEEVLTVNRPHEGALGIPNLTAQPDYVIQPNGYFLIVSDEEYYRRTYPMGPAPDLEGNLDFRSRNSARRMVDDPAKDGPAPNAIRHGNFGLNKNRDEVVLYNGHDVVDAVAWGSGNSFNLLTSEGLKPPSGMSISRIRDGEEAQEPHGELSELVGNSFTDNAVPTPKAVNQ